jgi:hypothetical protein
MLTIRNTPRTAGIEILGDHKDLLGLYLALHTVVGDDDEFHLEDARIRVLGVCYDLRHAMMGDRNIEFVDNGMDYDKIKRLGVVSSDKNVYYTQTVLWPEILYVFLALNNFVQLYAKSRSKTSPTPILDAFNLWDSNIAQVRLFQSLVVACLNEIVSEASFRRIVKLMALPGTVLDATQYVDLLNMRFVNMDPDKRKKSLLTMVKRLVEQGPEYQQLRQEVDHVATKNHCEFSDIDFSWSYPEKIDW